MFALLRNSVWYSHSERAFLGYSYDKLSFSTIIDFFKYIINFDKSQLTEEHGGLTLEQQIKIHDGMMSKKTIKEIRKETGLSSERVVLAFMHFERM